MPRTLLTRMILLLCLLGVFAVPAFAQEALPLPEAPVAPDSADGDVPPVVFIPMPAQPLQPADKGNLIYGVAFTWTNTYAAKYIVKFNVKATGTSFKWQPNYTCNAATCFASTYGSPVFDKLRDGQQVTWQVISKFSNVTLKSPKFMATVDEVAPVTPSSPADGSTIAHVDLNSLDWQGHNAINTRYLVTVKDTTLGMVVYVRYLNSVPYNCGDTCGSSIGGDKYDSFSAGHTYEWTVTAIGQTGEKIKSAKARFTLK